MIASLLATALLATSAAADEIIIPFRVDGRTLQSSHPTASGTASSYPGSHYTSTSKPTKKKSHSTQSSSISCKASASSKGFSYATDAHVEAGARCALSYAVTHTFRSRVLSIVRRGDAGAGACGCLQAGIRAQAR